MFSCHAYSTYVPDTATSSAHSIHNKYCLSCIYQVRQKDSYGHPHSIPGECSSVIHTAFGCLTLLPVVYTAFPYKFKAHQAYIKSCRRPPTVMHTAFPANVFLSCIQHLGAGLTLLPVGYIAFPTIVCLPCIHEVQHKVSSCHAHSISSKCFPIMRTAFVCLTLPPLVHTASSNKCLPVRHSSSPSKGLLLPYVGTALLANVFCKLQQMLSLSCINQVLPKDPSWHAHSISNKCLPVHAYSTGGPITATSGAYSISHPMFACHAYIKSCKMTSTVMYTACPADVSLSCVTLLPVVHTAFSN